MKQRSVVGSSEKHIAEYLHDDKTNEQNGLTSEVEVVELTERVALVALSPFAVHKKEIAQLEASVCFHVRKEHDVREEALEET